MRVIGLPVLEEFARRHADAKGRIQTWVAEVQAAHWTSPNDVRARYPHASFLKGNRVICNIKGNDYRLCAVVGYQSQIVRVELIWTHAEYDRWKF